MGITAEATKLVIFNVVDKLKNQLCKAHSDQLPSTSKRPSSVDFQSSMPKRQACVEFRVENINVYDQLEADKDSRDILNDKKIIPDKNAMAKIVRVVCAPFKAYLQSFTPAKYATLEEKETIAKKILETFPFLEATKTCETAPPHSAFFWKNGGAATYHEHTGFIQSYMRNSTRTLSNEKKKFTRSPKPSNTPCVPDELVQTAANCARFAASSANYNAIAKVMSEVHPLLMMMRSEKKDAQMIQSSYERINHEQYDKNADLRKIFSKGLLYSKNMFTSIEDDYLRGALRLMKTLTRRGTTSLPNAENVEPNTNTSVEQELAASLVVWVKNDQDLDAYGASDPHIICRNGEFFVYLAAGVVFSCSSDSVQCIDTFFKAFNVFNIKVPTKLIKIADFLDVLVFKVKPYTTRVGVRQLVAEFQEVEKAENAVQDVNV